MSYQSFGDRMPADASSFKYSIAPWLSVPSGAKVVDFYKSAFDAHEVYRHDAPGGGLVVRLSINGAEFWLSQEPSDRANPSPGPVGGDSVRMILTVPNPDAVFVHALKAGATEIFPVGEEHGWRLGRLADPFGLPLGNRPSPVEVATPGPLEYDFYSANR
jgi:PhnB protein